ncbi:pyrimidodiazepine synthase isoform X1 [Neodiprion pinetum]|uniref:Pyrimidodiazepine synthase-like isoform X1 n=1 Tax=Neodiprion lecontei TaxID=441921 RepID=A0ABM3FGL6_NEOLC|nr:pyrimidodiazepine synthase-like isoform X1 [Neodiprion pinetum]XP_046587164.1 pyrimidodiazepine synthase-like isoform X1 [Neodiprion lecontei]
MRLSIYSFSGSQVPPLVPGKLRLYSMRFCPFAQRVHLVLDAKKIPYDVVYVNLTHKPEWLVEKNPLSKVPLLELKEGNILYESLIIVDYLDEAYPEHRLYPKDPLLKAQEKLLIERFGAIIVLMNKVYYTPTMEREQFVEILNGLEIFDRELVRRGTPFFGGKQPGMVDLMIWPWCERADLIRILRGDQFVLPRERILRLLEWRSAMKEDEAVKGSYLDGETHAKFIRSRQAGSAQYDFLIAQ